MDTITLHRNTELFPRPLSCSEDVLPRFDSRTKHRPLVTGSQVGVLVIVVSFQQFWSPRIHIPILLRLCSLPWLSV